MSGYRVLAASLREAINQGEYQPGTTLPKQDELAERYSVNIKTIRQAVALLEAEGLVTAIRRRGTVVRERPPLQRLGIERYSKKKWKYGDTVAFIADREASGRPWERTDQTQTVTLIEADPEIMEAYGLQPCSHVYERARTVKDAGRPTHTLASYYLPEIVEGTPLVDPTPGPAGPGGGLAVLTLQGYEPDHMSETIFARMPTPEEAETLELPAGEPVMILTRRTYTANDVLIEFARGVHAASRFSWTYDFKLPE
ncbi:GntR family transcriptional regulator [Nocardia seriolae]|uniref:Regulator n=1 Tax=Nocardia seriolae TaxID=37332 RepID=A0A0B8NRX0_9NOCA|nr:GntR family transcriptional regulator [Nocardia seriolae]APA96593.1 putative HTH-type transcriptional regulator [Nocardia seriolae]MTJ61657.1 UTRA domain-containing protein [Nocardia seriolae]MTJ76094.1 UTRA domain-containing protein [Nocardia seriolae]MTJ86675.1 UTRA domain-containing protein [Nocardia seriolae]MTK30670.1 UTRA domain-containing protein [Nocardia seriolae]